MACIRKLIHINADYMVIPVRKGAKRNYLSIFEDKQVVREYYLELGDDKHDLWVFLDVSCFIGSELELCIEEPDDITDKALEMIYLTMEIDSKNEHFIDLYKEKYRPCYHFTSRRGWLNDPNGLVFINNTYHLFYQHNPISVEHGGVNIHWGHAISSDLIHWKELPTAINPESRYNQIFSGSAVADKKGTIIAAFTRHGSYDPKGSSKSKVAFFPSVGQCIAYSGDYGYTWNDYEKNPVIACSENNRDPRLFWYETENKWIMALYEVKESKNSIVFYSSIDLKSWDYLSHIAGFFECPDILPIPLDGDCCNMKWVLYAADGQYVIGKFDGKMFNAETERQFLDTGPNFYAGQTWSNIPAYDGRIIHIAWMAGGRYPGMPFNQQMTIATEIELKSVAGTMRLFRKPVREIQLLYSGEINNETVQVKRLEIYQYAVMSPADIDVHIESDTESFIFIVIMGKIFCYQPDENFIKLPDGRRIPISCAGNMFKMRLLVDTTSVEVFFNDGEVCYSYCYVKDETGETTIQLIPADNINVSIRDRLLKSIWS